MHGTFRWTACFILFVSLVMVPFRGRLSLLRHGLRLGLLWRLCGRHGLGRDGCLRGGIRSDYRRDSRGFLGHHLLLLRGLLSGNHASRWRLSSHLQPVNGLHTGVHSVLDISRRHALCGHIGSWLGSVVHSCFLLLLLLLSSQILLVLLDKDLLMVLQLHLRRLHECLFLLLHFRYHAYLLLLLLDVVLQCEHLQDFIH